MTTPFNPALHDHLLSIGFTYERIDPEWEDVGGPESGPDLVGHDGYDTYTGPTETFVCSSTGRIYHEFRDLELEAAWEREAREDARRYSLEPDA